jgi:hypothetical protein
VIAVNQIVKWHRGGPGTVGEYIRSVERTLGQVSERTRAHVIHAGISWAQSHKWVYKDGDQIDCTAALSGRNGERVYSSAIAAGGPCATHATMRLAYTVRGLIDARSELMNPDEYARAKDGYVAALNREGARLPECPTYRLFADNARRVGKETREERAVRQVLEDYIREQEQAHAACISACENYAIRDLKKIRRSCSKADYACIEPKDERVFDAWMRCEDAC